MPGKLLVVNKKDEILRSETKEKCHEKKGILHRAFSVFIFNNKNQLLLQRRSKFKLLWPLYWSNSCCSHPQKGEDIQSAAKKRLKEELGFTCPLELAGSFQYQAQYKNIGSENELCSIFIGGYNGKIRPNSKEVADWKWVSLSGLQRDIRKNPQKYTPWLKIELKFLENNRVLPLHSEIKNLNSILVQLNKIIESPIKNILLAGIDKKFQKIISYQILTGGKRLRSALSIICCKMLGGKLKDILYPAAGLELLHNYTLIIDDIIDNSTLRRGKPTIWFKFGKSAAECVGIDYSAAIFQAAAKSKNPVFVSELLAKTLKTVVDGEFLDILFEQAEKSNEPYITENRYQKITKRDYFDMIRKKTAILFQTSCELGGIAVSAKKEEIAALKNYGFNFGMAFQIQDDILDIFGEKKSFGKTIGKDIEEQKGGNIVTLLSLEELNLKDKKRFLKILKKKKMKRKDIKEAMKFIQKTNSHQKASLLGKQFAEKAKKSLESLPKNQWNEILRTLADFVLNREK